MDERNATLRAAALSLYPREIMAEMVPATCWGEPGPPPLDAANTALLLELQQRLRNQRLRGGMHEVRQWIANGDLCECVARNAANVGLFVSRDRLEANGVSTPGDAFVPFLSSYGDVMELLAADYLFKESMWARILGSCCLIGPDRVLTASHLIGETARILINKREFLVVFDFENAADGSPPAVMSKQQSVFTVIAVEENGGNGAPGADWVILRLDRAANQPKLRVPPTIAPLPIDFRRGAYTLGHPMACATRYLRTHEIWDNGVDADCYEGHLDSYDGISGAPVFDPISHQLIGLMIHSCPTPAGRAMTHLGQNLSPLCLGGDRPCGALIVSSQQFPNPI